MFSFSTFSCFARLLMISVVCGFCVGPFSRYLLVELQRRAEVKRKKRDEAARVREERELKAKEDAERKRLVRLRREFDAMNVFLPSLQK